MKQLRVCRRDVIAELLPLNGLSVGQVWVGQRPLFWEAPLSSLPEPEALDPRAPLLVDGRLLEGFGWIAGFMGGIELLGLRNWGMPRRDPDSGELLCLHGEAARLPAERVRVEERGDRLEVRAELVLRDLGGPADRPWWERGAPLYRLERRLVFGDDHPGLFLCDTIFNLTDREQVPDWGYHVQLRPQPGAAYRVPSREVHGRGGTPPARDHETWKPASRPGRREERGVVHRGLLRTPGCLEGAPAVRTLLSYPDGTGIEVDLPPAAYLMSWFSAGGAGGSEFLLPRRGGSPSRSLLERDWNGVGPEIGASALDHDGDADPEEPVRALGPGESLELRMSVRWLDAAGARDLEREIEGYNRQRH